MRFRSDPEAFLRARGEAEAEANGADRQDHAPEVLSGGKPSGGQLIGASLGP